MKKDFSHIKRTENFVELADGTTAKIVDLANIKVLKSPNYNFIFNRISGQFARWGSCNDELPQDYKVSIDELAMYKTWKSIWGEEVEDFKTFVKNLQDDGSPYAAPEILDIEISLLCSGTPRGVNPKASSCRFCYKSNVCGGDPKIKNMSFDEYKIILDKMPESLVQVALGIGDINSNPDLWKICDYTRSKGVIPNITFNGYFPNMNEEEIQKTYDRMANTFGAMAISHYSDDLCFNAIHELATKREMSQINIHFMISKQTFEQCKDLIEKLSTDERAKNLNALVLLSLKKKGNAVKNHFESLSQEEFEELCELAESKGISLGMDSCSGQKAYNFYSKKENAEEIIDCIEPCESSLYSTYINTTNLLDKELDHSDPENRGCYFSCSFCEGEISNKFPELDWRKGISVLSDNCKDFMKDVWCHPKTEAFRKRCVECRESGIACAMFDI